jgi:spermidine synthase
VISWEALGRAQVPGGGGVMDLFRRGTELSIRVDGRELMSSRVHGSEDALAELACGKVRTRPEARVLIGGLGMGFTLAAALRTLQDDAVVEISELVPEVVAWNRGPIGPVAGHPLEDPRVLVQQRDVGEVIREGEDRYDAIMLDVDNGPTGLTRSDNDWLYGHTGLAAAWRALRRGGVLAVWSAAPDRAFTRRLGHAGFQVEEVVVRARGDKGGRRHTIWLGRREAPRR